MPARPGPSTGGPPGPAARRTCPDRTKAPPHRRGLREVWDCWSSELIFRRSCLLVQTSTLVLPLRRQGAKVRLHCPCMVSAEKKFPTGGFQYRAHVSLSAAAVTAVQRIELTCSNCCCHECLLKGVDTSYNHLCRPGLSIKARLSLCAYQRVGHIQASGQWHCSLLPPVSPFAGARPLSRCRALSPAGINLIEGRLPPAAPPQGIPTHIKALPALGVQHRGPPGY